MPPWTRRVYSPLSPPSGSRLAYRAHNSKAHAGSSTSSMPRQRNCGRTRRYRLRPTTIRSRPIHKAACNISSVDILQKSISIELNAENGRKRFFHGMVKSFEAGGQNGHFFNYRVEMVPQLWFLKSTKLYRIFEDMTVIDIIRQ